MEKGVRKICSYDPAEKDKLSCSSDGKSSKDASRTKKEVNSWDRSTLNSTAEAPKGKANDWDSSSDCQETMVVPFHSNENADKGGDDWDSESEGNKGAKAAAGGKGVKPLSLDSFDSYEMSMSEKSGEDEWNIREDSLLLEDFEEFVRESEVSRGTSKSGADCEKVRSKPSEGTPEDTTIWMIPKSERTQSRESTSKLISSSDREKLDKFETFKNFLKKTKSLSDVQKSKIRRRTARSSRSEYLGCQKNNYNSFLVCEGSDLKRKLEIDSGKPKENVSGCFDRTRVFFTEYECRTMTMDKNAPEKLSAASRSLLRVTEEMASEVADEVSDDSPENSIGRNSNQVTSSVGAITEMGRAGPSGQTSMDVLSLPDMVGRKALKERKSGDGPPEDRAGGRTSAEEKSANTEETSLTESWLLLDDTGQYQAITKNVVSILLNGRSAEAVLQGRKEHFIPNIRLKDTGSLKDSLSSMLVQESLQHVLKQEDMGGEDDRKRIIDLERKVENTLFYIQPGMNHAASIRIIPLDTEMIHIWRRTKEERGSVLSLEVDVTNASQHSVETANQRNTNVDCISSIARRPFVEEAVSEVDETPAQDTGEATRHEDTSVPGIKGNEISNYAKMLLETRMIVDTLTNNFKTLQNRNQTCFRLDGETTQSRALQAEVNKLRTLLKNSGGKPQDLSREACPDVISMQSNPTSGPSFLVIKDQSDVKSDSREETDSKATVEFLDKSTSMECVPCQFNQRVYDQLNEGNEVITVNIYTMESFTSAFNYGRSQDYSRVQSNLRMIEEKMINLQQENEIVLKQNSELKKKLREISLELEKYLASTSGHTPCIEEGRELETLRDQVCNLKLELENVKKVVRVEKGKFPEQKSLVEEEFTKSLNSLKEWCRVAGEILKKIETTTRTLQENEIGVDLNLDSNSGEDPETFSNLLLSYLEQSAECLVNLKNENVLLEQTLQEDLPKEGNPSGEISSLDQVISGYSELIEQCKKGQITGETETKVMEDYFAVIVEKASLMEEIKILKTENEMLLESQLEHYEKLKQTMIALKERKSEITALESSQKLLEEERSKMAEVLKLSEEEKKTLQTEITEKRKTIEDFVEEIQKRDSELADCKERLNAAVNDINNFEKSNRLKEELINELKMENDKLMNEDGIKSREIEILKNEIKNWEMQGNQLEAELTSSKLFLNESQKEMTDYITHLEALVNNSQESIDKLKQKLKETNQIVSRLKSENDVLDKQHHCDVKLFNNTKDELDSSKERLGKAEKRLKESEEEREKLHSRCESLASSEKEKTEALELLSRQYKAVLEENSDLIEKVQIVSRDKDETLKEQKDLINKYAILSKDIHKLQDKYRSVKSECNERTDLIKYLEMMLRENIAEYNNRIGCLEQNISRIIEKIVACKDGIKEKHFVVAEVRELRHQLDVTYKERKEMENIVNNYYSLTKHLEYEIQQREKKVDELHAKLSLEQQKTVEYENERKSSQVLEVPSTPEYLRIEQLESQMAITDSELVECKKELQRSQAVYENEKKKLELTIADLKSEVKRYQLRMEVMMKNLSNSNRNNNSLTTDKRTGDESEIQTMKKELQEKTKIITELNDTINKYKAEVKLKDSDLESSYKRGCHQDEEVKNLRNQLEKLQEAMSTANRTSAVQQKEKDEMAEKLMQSIRLVMEERSARQTLEAMVAERERNFKNQTDQIKNELALKVKECELMSEALEQKKALVSRLQDDMKKMKAEVSSLRLQVGNYKKRNIHRGSGDSTAEDQFFISNPTTLIRPQNLSSERLESCLKELKEIRDVNLELRKTEGQYQAKIVRLEDEIRDARLLIKELQGDIKTEKKSKKAFKNMIMAAKMEIEKCVLAKQLMSVIAERINRHLSLSEIPSREFLSGFRLSDSLNSPK